MLLNAGNIVINGPEEAALGLQILKRQLIIGLLYDSLLMVRFSHDDCLCLSSNFCSSVSVLCFKE